MMSDQLNTQLDTHFKSADELPTVDPKSQVVIPEIDLEKYSAKKVYDAFQFIVKALTQRAKVNQALKAYDGSILQDYLHTIEVVNLDDIEINKFAESLKLVRRKRRKIKNLALILNALADNLDAEKILKLLYQNPSLGKQYHYRDADTGNLLLGFISNEKFLSDIENK